MSIAGEASSVRQVSKTERGYTTGFKRERPEENNPYTEDLPFSPNSHSLEERENRILELEQGVKEVLHQFNFRTPKSKRQKKIREDDYESTPGLPPPPPLPEDLPIEFCARGITGRNYNVIKSEGRSVKLLDRDTAPELSRMTRKRRKVEKEMIKVTEDYYGGSEPIECSEARSKTYHHKIESVPAAAAEQKYSQVIAKKDISFAEKIEQNRFLEVWSKRQLDTLNSLKESSIKVKDLVSYLLGVIAQQRKVMSIYQLRSRGRLNIRLPTVHRNTREKWTPFNGRENDDFTAINTSDDEPEYEDTVPKPREKNSKRPEPEDGQGSEREPTTPKVTKRKRKGRSPVTVDPLPAKQRRGGRKKKVTVNRKEKVKKVTTSSIAEAIQSTIFQDDD